MKSLTEDDVRDIAHEIVKSCREEVDVELQRVSILTDEQIAKVANKAADLAVSKITEDFYAGVGKRFITALGAAVVVIVITTQDALRAAIAAFFK